ncbi:MAG TPA: serine/threonine-protein kinase [Blastocatellia bacterium]|nr:serine/threonine-protein kinase [Blastocatellia bacterium]
MKRCPQCGQEYKDNARFCPRDGYNLDMVSSEPTMAGSNPIEVPEPGQTDPLIGRILAARYRLLQKLGQGGMGAVYKGQHIKMNRMTAIKVLTAQLAEDPQFVARFEREAEMASHIDHPNAVNIYDFGEAEDGLVYIAMEFIEGQPLSSIIEKEGALALDRVVRITYQAADALHAAHNLGIIHRDFKPDNIMVCQKSGRPDWVEVVDFGIAKRAALEPENQGLTQTGFILGTPAYMSPEQVAGEPLDVRSDLYSLALVSYEMITGTLPFTGNSVQSVMVNRLLQPPMSFRQVRPGLNAPPAVEAVIMRALARHARDRYSSTVEFASELERAFRQFPGLPPPQPQPQRPAHAPNTPPAGHRQTPVQPQPHQPTPVQQPRYQPTPQPMQPPFQPPHPMSSAFPHQSYTPTPLYHQQPPKSKAWIVVLIIVLVFLMLMGSCFMLAAIGDL